MLHDRSQRECGEELQAAEDQDHPDQQADEQRTMRGQGADRRRQAGLGDQRPGYVNVGQPMEAVYAMVPVASSLKSVSLQVLRFFTAVHDKNGNFQGYLLLSLDMKDLRNIVSRYS